MSAYPESDGPRKDSAWISSAAPGTAVERVGRALTENLRRDPDFCKAYFNMESGMLEELQGGQAARPIAKGLRGLKKTAFLLSLKGKLPRYRACFVDNQNLAFLAPARACLFVHDLFYRTHPKSVTEWVQGRVQYHGLGRFEAYMVNSLYTRDRLMERGIAAERIGVFPLACDGEVFHPAPVDRDAVRHGLGLPGNARLLFHVSSGERRKNLDGILRAFAKLAKDMPDLHLIKAGRDLKSGSTPLAATLARQLGVGDRVHFLGAVDDSRLADLYRASDCFVFPSLAEGFGLPVLEAQACGCPVVTSNVTALPEVAGPLSLMVDPGNPDAIATAISKVLADPGLRERGAEANRAWLAGFSWEPGRRFLEGFLRSSS